MAEVFIDTPAGELSASNERWLRGDRCLAVAMDGRLVLTVRYDARRERVVVDLLDKEVELA